MKDGIAVDGGTDIDDQDACFATSVYPKLGVPLRLLVHLQGIGDVGRQIPAKTAKCGVLILVVAADAFISNVL